MDNLNNVLTNYEYRRVIEEVAHHFVDNMTGNRNRAMKELLDMARVKLPKRYKRKIILSDLRSAIYAFEHNQMWNGGYSR